MVLDQKIPEDLYSNTTSCIVGLVADPERLSDIRRNRVAIMQDQNLKEYTDLESIKKEVEDSKKLFKKTVGLSLMLLEDRLKKLQRLY